MIEVLTLLLLLLVCIVSAVLIATCPSFDSFFSLVTDTPNLEEYMQCYCLRHTPASQQLEYALLRCRAEAAAHSKNYLLWRVMHLRFCDNSSNNNLIDSSDNETSDDHHHRLLQQHQEQRLSFYGMIGRWRMSRGSVFKYSVFLAFRDKAPLLDSYIDDKKSAAELAEQWQDAEQSFLQQDDSRESMLAFAKIADSLHQQYGYSLLAQMDAALALLLAYKAAENLGDFIERRGVHTSMHTEPINFLIRILDLVKRTRHLRFIEAIVADILFEKGCYERALEHYRNVVQSNAGWWHRKTDLYYYCVGQLAQANFILKNYAAVISHSTTVLEYYRDRLDITEESITKLVLLRCQSQLAQLQWDAWLQDREWVQRFTLIFGNTPELNFLTKLYSAWENRDPESYQHSCREFDRAFQMTDEQIRILMLGKEKLVELVSTRLKA